jgi:hypothetical protein
VKRPRNRRLKYCGRDDGLAWPTVDRQGPAASRGVGLKANMTRETDPMKQKIIVSAVAAVLAGASALASAAVPFTPLTSSATALETNEATNPFKLPDGWSQTKVIDVAALNTKFSGNYPTTFRAFDMIDFSKNRAWLFIPHEVQQGAGVTALHLASGSARILLQGNNTGVYATTPTGWSHLNDDFGGLDPAVTTPWGSLLTAEEWAGGGRMFECLNPTTAKNAAQANWRWLSNIPSVSHEGIKFDKDGNMYFIDEDNSGSIYKFVPTTAGDLTQGQVFVLKIDAYAGAAAQTWDNAANVSQRRTGLATWVAMTDANGVALTTANPFDYANRGGRLAADELAATPYGRPEDLIIGKNPNTGSEMLYFAATSERIVYAVELRSDTTAVVSEYVNAYVTPDTIGNTPVGTGSGSVYGITSPDNLAIDKAGNIYVVEDQNPGDIWFVSDTDRDGTGASVSMFASLGPFGSEPTGFIADSLDPFKFWVSVQHPSSDNDAVWTIQHDLSGSCACGTQGSRDNYLSCVKTASQAMVTAGDLSAAQRNELLKMAQGSVCKQ